MDNEEINVKDRISLAKIETKHNYFIARPLRDSSTFLEHQPVMLLILTIQKGIRFKFSFATIKELNPQLIEHFLQLTTQMSLRVFKKQGYIERIKLIGYTLIFRSVGSLVFCYIFQGDTYAAAQKFDSLIQSLLMRDILTDIKKDNFSTDSHHKIESIITELFDIEEEIQEERGEAPDLMPISSELIPKGFFQLQTLWHPVRLAIIRILNRYYRIPASELNQILGISWGKLKHHIDALIKAEMIVSQQEIIDTNPRVVLYIDQRGIQQYKELQNHLQSLFETTI